MEKHFLLFNDQLAESGCQKTKGNVIPCGKFCLVENDPYMDASSLVYNIKIDDFYEDITSNIKAGFNMSGYSCSQVCPLPMEVNKEVIDLMKDELGRKIMTEFMTLTLKLYDYKMLSGSGDKKCIVKKILDFEDHKQCLLAA